VADRELLTRASEIVDLATRSGADGAWSNASRSRNVSYTYRDGKLEEVKDSTSRGISLRLYVDGRFSVHSTTDLRPAQLRSFIDEAVALTRALEPDPYRSLPDPSLFEGRSESDLELVDPATYAIDRERRLDWCRNMDERVVGKPDVVSASSSAGNAEYESAAASSNGFSGTYASTSAWLACEVTLRDKDDSRPAEWMAASARHLSALPAPAEIADEALVRARGLLGSVKGPTLRGPMVVERRIASRLIHRLCGPASGSAVQQGRSFWKDRLGKQVVSEKLTVIDDPLIVRGLASRPFDGEGIAARPLDVVQSGQFANLYLDTYYAKKLGMPPTTGSASNHVIELGDKSCDEILGCVGSGIYVTAWLGGNMDSTSGDFSLGVRGHRIEAGKLAAPIGEMNITGNILELFSNLVEIGNDPWPFSATRAPTLAFADVQFSGE